MNLQHLIPKDKFDIKSLEKLSEFTIEDIKPIIPSLLKWTQDGNWPNSGIIMNYFTKHINEIDDEIIAILRGNDSSWKYWIIMGIIKDSPHLPNHKILTTLLHIVNNVSSMDKEEEIDIISREILKRANNQ